MLIEIDEEYINWAKQNIDPDMSEECQKEFLTKCVNKALLDYKTVLTQMEDEVC